MGLEDLQLKLKTFHWKKLLYGGGGNEKRKSLNGKRASWMMPVSHGYHVVEERSFCAAASTELDPNKVVAQREQIEENELWFFGVFDAGIGDGITKYMQAHLFDKKLEESQIMRSSKETMRKAHLTARSSVRETEKLEEIWKLGSATAIVINGDKLVIANMGEYKVVVCRDGKAYEINRRQQKAVRRYWPHRFISGAFREAKARLIARNSSNATVIKPPKSSELVAGSERIGSNTEFVILASIGIWEVMKHQEAVNLIWHIEDAQEAAECLAKEALNRMSKSNISCLIIRFDQ